MTKLYSILWFLTWPAGVYISWKLINYVLKKTKEI